MSAWLAWRLVKFVALAAFAAGLVGAVSGSSRSGRVASVHGLATPGFVGLWVAGFAMMKITERGLGTPWIVAALIASFVALHGAFLASHDRRGEGTSVAPALAVGGLGASLGVMVLRPDSHAVLTGVLLVGAVLGALVARPWRARLPVGDDAADVAAEVRRGFRRVAWLEGLTLIFMVGVSMPARKLLGVHLDGGTGLVGWVHGVAVLVYLQALLSTGTTLGWGRRRLLGGVVASLLPGGTFVFERRVRDEGDAVGPARAA